MKSEGYRPSLYKISENEELSSLVVKVSIEWGRIHVFFIWFEKHWIIIVFNYKMGLYIEPWHRTLKRCCVILSFFLSSVCWLCRKDAVSSFLLWVSHLWACVGFVKVRRRKLQFTKQEQIYNFFMVLDKELKIYLDSVFPPDVHFGKCEETELTHNSWCHSSKEYLLLLLLLMS